MKILTLSLFALLVLAEASCAAEELRATLKVSGRQIDVQVRHDNGEPADGVPVRLLYGRQLTSAVGHTDSEGHWRHLVTQSGAYEAVVETGPRPDEVIRLAFSVLTSEAAGFPWLKAVLFLLCVCGIGLLVIVTVRCTGQVHLHRLVVVTGLPAVGAALLGYCVWLDWNQQLSAARSEPDLSVAARKYLRRKEVKPLSESLDRLLHNTSFQPVKTQPHPLLNQLAPDFKLADHGQKTWSLHERLAHGPVVLVFYYGYHCNHCVGQLFALHDDIEKFHELGADVLAISADPPELTRARFRQYGEFAFPVLADPGNRVGQAYRIYQPASPESSEDLKHATFVIGRDGQIRWARTGYQPFTDNRTLLMELARELEAPARASETPAREENP